MTKQKLQSDLLHQEAELKISQKQKKLSELEKKFKKVLNDNQSLPEHVRLKPEVRMCALSLGREVHLVHMDVVVPCVCWCV